MTTSYHCHLSQKKLQSLSDSSTAKPRPRTKVMAMGQASLIRPRPHVVIGRRWTAYAVKSADATAPRKPVGWGWVILPVSTATATSDNSWSGLGYLTRDKILIIYIYSAEVLLYKPDEVITQLRNDVSLTSFHALIDFTLCFGCFYVLILEPLISA